MTEPHGDQVFTAECAENDFVRLPARSRIVSAWYGKASNARQGKDITRKTIKLHAPTNDQDYVIHASSEQWGDPWLGAAKKLIVQYTMPKGLVVKNPSDHLREYTAREGEKILIPRECWIVRAKYGKMTSNRPGKDVTDKVKRHCVRTKCAPLLVSKKIFGGMMSFGASGNMLIVKVSEPIPVYNEAVVTATAVSAVPSAVVQAVHVQVLKEGEIVPAPQNTTIAAPVAAVPVNATSAAPVAAVPVMATRVNATSAAPVAAVPVTATRVNATTAAPVQATYVGTAPSVPSAPSAPIPDADEKAVLMQTH